MQMGVKFWSTSFAAPKPPNMNLLVELVDNYPPMPLVTQKTVRSFYSLSPSRHNPCLIPPLPTCRHSHSPDGWRAHPRRHPHLPRPCRSLCRPRSCRSAYSHSTIRHCSHLPIIPHPGCELASPAPRRTPVASGITAGIREGRSSAWVCDGAGGGRLGSCSGALRGGNFTLPFRCSTKCLLAVLRAGRPQIAAWRSPSTRIAIL